MSFVNAVKQSKTKAVARTANGMKAKATSASPVLDLFSLIGSARGTDITKQFVASFVENADLTMRMLQWARDIREGAGERATFRNLLSALESTDPTLAGKLMHKIPALGRWDDLFAYKDATNRNQAFALIAEALQAGSKAKALLDNFDNITEEQAAELLKSYTD